MYDTTWSSSCWHALSIREWEGSDCGAKLAQPDPILCFTYKTLLGPCWIQTALSLTSIFLRKEHGPGKTTKFSRKRTFELHQKHQRKIFSTQYHPTVQVEMYNTMHLRGIPINNAFELPQITFTLISSKLLGAILKGHP